MFRIVSRKIKIKKKGKKLKMMQFPCKDISTYIEYLQMPRTVTTSRESTSMVTSIEYIRLLYAFSTLFRS